MEKVRISYEVEVDSSVIKLKHIFNGNTSSETIFHCDGGEYSRKVMLRNAYLLAAYRFLYNAAAVMPENNFVGVTKDDMLREWKYLKDYISDEQEDD